MQNIEERYILPANATQAQKDQRDRFIGEVRFYRAHLYWEMIKVYGGVPIITKVIDKDETDESLLYPKRNTTEESFTFVIKELKEAADLLPITYSGDNWGRITKGAALAYCARIQLYKASPMFNPSNERKYWKDAYDTYKDVIELDIYDLHPTFSEIWKEKGENNKEIIWFKDYKKGTITHGWDAGNMMRSQAVGDATANCPVQELVDAFPMKDGTPYVKSNPETNPYDYRDPRLRETVVWNGDTYGPRNEKVYTFVSESTDPNSPMYNFDGIDSHQSATSTGYYMRKMKDELWMELKVITDMEKGAIHNGLNFDMRKYYWGWLKLRTKLRNGGRCRTIKVDSRSAGILPGENKRYGIPENISMDDFRTWFKMRDI